MVEKIIASARRLDRTNPTPRITAKDLASSTINGVQQLLNSLDGTSATTYALHAL